MKSKIAFFILFCYAGVYTAAPQKPPSFKVIGFYTAKNDAAHISFVHEANSWFYKMGNKYHFSYDSTNDWNNLNTIFLSNYQVVVFLDTRPDSSDQRIAFQKYME